MQMDPGVSAASFPRNLSALVFRARDAFACYALESFNYCSVGGSLFPVIYDGVKSLLEDNASFSSIRGGVPKSHVLGPGLVAGYRRYD